MADKDEEPKQEKPIKADPTDEKEHELTPEEDAILRRVVRAVEAVEADEEKTSRKIDEKIMRLAEKIRQEREKDETQKEEIPDQKKAENWTGREEEREQDKQKDTDPDKTPPR